MDFFKTLGIIICGFKSLLCWNAVLINLLRHFRSTSTLSVRFNLSLIYQDLLLLLLQELLIFRIWRFWIIEVSFSAICSTRSLRICFLWIDWAPTLILLCLVWLDTGRSSLFKGRLIWPLWSNRSYRIVWLFAKSTWRSGDLLLWIPFRFVIRN